MSWQERVRQKYHRDQEAGKVPLILAIETSCDETSAAVIRNGRDVLSNIVSSQVEIHQQFGGVVPEVASRRHVENVATVVGQSLRAANVALDDLSAVAVTYGPGLVGALLVGVAAAKAISFAKSIPLIGVHHIAGHIYANFLAGGMQPPLVALVVSGGHTELVYMKEHGKFEFLGRTRDDAAGEAYDKVARTIGLPYPGGPRIDKLAVAGNPESIVYPRAWLEEGSLDFSFSGLKSSVINSLHNAQQRGEQLDSADVAAAFQASVVEVLVEKTVLAVRQTGVSHVVVAGGVAANQGLRARMRERAAEAGFSVTFPPIELCTDNAAMIGAAAYRFYLNGQFHDMDLNGIASLPLTKWQEGPFLQM